MAGMKDPPEAPDGRPWTPGEDQSGDAHQAVQAQLEAHVETGAALSPQVHAHLRTCAPCRAHLALLLELQAALLEDVPDVAPPPDLRAQVLRAARTSPRPGPDNPEFNSGSGPDFNSGAGHAAAPGWRWWPAALGAAVLTGVLALGAWLGPGRGLAASLPDPAVVVATPAGLVIASNDPHGTLSVIRSNAVTASVRTAGRGGAWFTEGVRLGDRVFLADAANDRVLEVQPQPLRVVRVYAVPDGIAGLTASSDASGGRVYFKGARGEVGALNGPSVVIAREPGMPLADVMDGVLLAGGALFVTHHVSGEVCLLDPVTLAVRRRVPLGGHPVALARVRDGVLVLDVAGRLLRLSEQGDVTRSWAVAGHPDKLSVNGEVALLTDRAGLVTRVDLQTGAVRRVQATHPMDVVGLPDGRFAVAEGGRGVRLLDTALRTVGRVQD